MDQGRGSWFWTIVAGVIVATVPPIVLFWVGINKPATVPSIPPSPPVEPRGGELLKPGTTWSGVFQAKVGKDALAARSRLLIGKREDGNFAGQMTFGNDDIVLDVEGTVEQNTISWKVLQVVRAGSKQLAKNLATGRCDGVLTGDTIDAHWKQINGPGNVKLRLEK